MENSTEMKDTLQIMLHAFLRMKEVGKKPNCQFVHQNVGDVSAHDNNARDRNKLLQRLNEMTQAAARMEKRGDNRKFTDIMEYDAKKNNGYIPGLWHGNPPMAPVNTGYSETVYQFKKSLIEVCRQNKDPTPCLKPPLLDNNNIQLKAVKYENFIFSFRNSLVAEAYRTSDISSEKSVPEPSTPGEIKIDSVGSNSVSLSWGSPASMDEIPHSFKVTSSSFVEDNILSITAPSNSTVMSELRPGREYSFTVTTVLENGTQSTPVSTSACTSLKSPELAQLEDSYEHDNELATLVVGLSDVTIINIAMENSTEMKDTLQIMLHAFLRMKEVGKKPNCQFVHQNVGDVSAHDKNMRERKMLLEQLNEMTQAASRMEKGPNRKFTDIMEYDAENNNWYIPDLWHGNPPMAPVNTGYSETVYEFKKSLIELLKSCSDQKPPAQITEFLEWHQTTSWFIQRICSNLDKDLVISREEELGAVLFLKNSNNKEFAQYLQDHVKDLAVALRAEFSQGCDVEKKLINLPFKPQDELFKRMFGCGKQCPFCKVPCEAGGQDHKEHHASVHRPQGLGRYRHVSNEKLTENVCTSNVFSETKFRNSDTKGEWHPYKDYRRFYPDWNIPPDPSIEASDYWKYVLTRFNEEFAVEYNAKPADVPKEWRSITKEMAKKSVSKLFNVKT
ncbi:interferon-induced very large GTPase 1-like [Polyodon spathula]|uniref:interferon-induced very large GTPase 1-like n=1 Tax=Polyodon spathula TaxID=7913 RepID=UPI001B7EE5FA|nr:interferon-induced very large GTPase 1-like [Polyodon spathula]